MRISCNGCRVLRKGCSENCIIKPCLGWIKSPQSQSNATLFLAKFYGRAGLLNLINGGPPHLRPSIFKSLLHEACGRMLDPVHGSAGLVSTGRWQLCEAAVEAVLNGSPVCQAPLDSTGDHVSSFFSACDIRHVSKNEKESGRAVPRLRNPTRFKRFRVVKPKVEVVAELEADSSGVDSVGCSDLVCIESVEDTLVKPIGLELILGRNLFPILEAHKEVAVKQHEDMNGGDAATWSCDLTLGLPPTSVLKKNSFGSENL